MKHCYKTNCPCKACSDAEDLHNRIQENTMNMEQAWDKHCEALEQLEASILEGASKMPLNHWEVRDDIKSLCQCQEAVVEAVYNGYLVTGMTQLCHGELVDKVYDIEIEGLA